MPASPTILFSSFSSPADPSRQSWARFREQVGARPPAITPAPSVKSRTPASAPSLAAQGESGIWRLLAPNNREVGRSSFLYATFQGARDHVLQLRENVSALVIAPVAGPFADAYGWVLTLNGDPVMTCTRWFPSAATSNDAAESAFGHFGAAIVTEFPQRTTSSGRRTIRAPGRGSSVKKW